MQEVTSRRVGSWLFCSKVRTHPTIQLVCFPYAGSGTWVYRNWHKYLPETIEVWMVELPGRGARHKEKLVTQMPELVAELLPTIRSQFNRPYALFGHSLGGMIAVELAAAIRTAGLLQPSHLFISGANPPGSSMSAESDVPIYRLPPAEFMERVISMGGTPSEFFANPELLAITLPALLADFELSSGSTELLGGPFDCPMTVLVGKDDPTTSVEIAEKWRTYAGRSFQIQVFPGDHFFLNQSTSQILVFIAEALARCFR